MAHAVFVLLFLRCTIFICFLRRMPPYDGQALGPDRSGFPHIGAHDLLGKSVIFRDRALQDFVASDLSIPE
ncbi:hypothetical protein ATN84_07595 [Paramesorhizobium deserti]|uniref:Uncharacterized protein n=1 Tax=Paramesorhizobium deserti TaxID=1494590 RepID=A0A135HVM5_9HYPH|nr:hypothetical protein ATN84_07595 [Paramesorhizobium deserti]